MKKPMGMNMSAYIFPQGVCPGSPQKEASPSKQFLKFGSLSACCMYNSSHIKLNYLPGEGGVCDFYFPNGGGGNINLPFGKIKMFWLCGLRT